MIIRKVFIRLLTSTKTQKERMKVIWAQLHKPNETKEYHKWEFLQPFPLLRRTFLHAIRGKSTEGELKTIGNTMTVGKNLPEHGE